MTDPAESASFIRIIDSRDAATLPNVAPDFTLLTHTGDIFHLAGQIGPAGLLLVFYRGHWCPYCRRYLGKLAANAGRFAERGIALVAISPEPPATSRRLAERLHINFPLLCDSDGAVVDLYGVRNGFGGGAAARGSPVLPHPAVFLLDPGRMIRFKSIDRNYKRRTTMHALFGAIAVAAEKEWSPQMNTDEPR